MILAHALTVNVGDLGNILAIASGDLHDNVKRSDRSVIGDVCANAERNLAFAHEMLINVSSLVKIQAVLEQQGLILRIDAEFFIMLQHFFTPFDWVAAVMSDTGEQGSVSQIKVS